jgi:Fe-S cluster assembly ATP-binding protein
MNILEIKNLELIKDGMKIIHGLDLSVEEGRIHAILGPNGSGKSTLAYMLMGLKGYEPSAGKMIFSGIALEGKSITDRARLGITLAWQEPAKFEGITVEDYLKISMRRRKLSEEEEKKEIERVLKKVYLEPERYLKRDVSGSLSGGERKRIELASVLSFQPKLAILDEPDSGIDIIAMDKIMNMIKELKEIGSTVLLITHREEIAKISDVASLLCWGRIVETCDPEIACALFREGCENCEGVQR